MTNFQFNENVKYLEDKDFDSNGNLLPPSDKSVVAMIAATWCGHCQTTKPVFQELANMMNGKNVYTAVILTDGPTEGEKKLGSRVGKMIPGFRGFPTIVKFVNGKYDSTYNGPRKVDSLSEFCE